MTDLDQQKKNTELASAIGAFLFILSAFLVKQYLIDKAEQKVKKLIRKI